MVGVEMSKASVLFYKVYHLDKSGDIKGSALVQAWNDTDALQKASGLGLDNMIEVWDRTRFVGVAGSAPVMGHERVSARPTDVLEAAL